MVRSCYLCQTKDVKRESISFHRFPKNLDIRRKWIAACGLTESDDLSHLYICSRHFRNEDFPMIPTSHRPRLNPGSVPSIKVKTSTVAGDLPQTVNTPIQPVSPNFIDNEGMEDPLTSENVIMINPLREESCILSVTSENMSSNDDAMEMPSLSENVESNPSSSGPKEICTQRKRRFAEPRYISEISVSDVATPKKARKIINFVKRINLEKTQQVKRLQNKNRKLLNRIATLKEMMSHLHGKGLISEEAEDTLMVKYLSNYDENLLQTGLHCLHPTLIQMLL